MPFQRNPTMRFQRNQGPDLCLYLLNNQNCHDQDCQSQKSHIPWEIRAAQRRASTILCWNSPNCNYLLTDTCCFFHPPEERARVRRHWMERVTELHCGLMDLEMVETAVGGLAVDGGLIGVSDVQDLASFNKTRTGEIAVPGLSLLSPVLYPLGH